MMRKIFMFRPIPRASKLKAGISGLADTFCLGSGVLSALFRRVAFVEKGDECGFDNTANDEKLVRGRVAGRRN